MKKVQSNPKVDNITEILKRLTRRIEEATVDLHEMKRDYKFINLRLGVVERNTEITKVDVEKLREQLEKTENRLDSRITTVGDLITIAFTKRYDKVEKRVSKLEHQQAVA